MPTVSVIVPCYNQGHFVDEAVDSVLAQSFTDFEIIIVNDGSTDSYTNGLLQDYPEKRARVITTDNQGLAAARNNGIAAARGKYILPLDADDKILPDYLARAVAELERDPQVGIVYCKADLFGAVDTAWNLPEYSLSRMLVDNIIFCSAFFRRDDWLAVGGYDPGMVYGWEDYDFWLGLIERGRKVVMIPETLFLYRVASDSMVRSKEKWQKVSMFKRIFERHQQLFATHIEVWLDVLLETRERYFTSRFYVDCGNGISDRSSVGLKIDGGTREVVFDVTGFQSIHAVRFDPVDTQAVVAIDRVMAVLRDGETVELPPVIESNALYREGDLLLFDTRDPQCFFPALGPDTVSQLVRLSVELRFVALAEQALEYIVAYQKQQLHRRQDRPIAERFLRHGGKLVHSLITLSRQKDRE